MRLTMTNLGSRSETVEFKEGKKQFDKGVKTLVAMLNSYHSGTVYFGVNEAGDVIGLDLCETAPERIRESIETYVRPAIETSIQIMKTDDGLQYVSVSATSGCMIYSFDDRYYIRSDMSNVIAPPEELVRLIVSQKRGTQKDESSETQIQDDLNQNLRKVLNCLRKNNTVKLTDVSKKTGISLSSVKKDVLELKRLGYVDNEGTNRNSVWIVKQK